MDPSRTPQPLDIAAVSARMIVTPERVRTRLEPTMLTIWVDAEGDEPLLVIDSGDQVSLRLTAESGRRFARGLAGFVRDWSP